jgi:hypothetical protein
MKEPLRHDPIDALGDAYEKLYEHVASNYHNAEKKTESLFQKLLQEVKDNASEMKELSEHDAEKIADWIKRDILDLANYLSDTEREVKDWLGFETSLIENKFLELLLKTADQTTAKLLQLKAKTYLASEYHAGEIVCPGTFSCDNCEERVHIHRAGKLPPCSKCNATDFHRCVN